VSPGAEPVDAIRYPGERPPAPGRLRLVQRFVNTVDYENGREMRHSPERLEALLVDLGLVRNRSARWCQMAVCGNRTTTRAYRARRAS
jgi:hypothetical protein